MSLFSLGTGGLGKSCLAGKICERFPDHTLIIVHSKLNSITLETALTDAFILSQDEKGQQILSQKMEMTKKLANLCATGFKEKNYLLLLDDFIREHVNRELLHKCGEELVRFLRCFSIYRRPVPEEGVKLVTEKAGVEDWKELMKEGMSLSLVEHDQARRSYQVSPLLRDQLLEGLEDITPCHEAAFAYYRNICEGRDPVDPILSEEWIFHAMGCKRKEVVPWQGSELVVHLKKRLALQESRRRGEEIAPELSIDGAVYEVKQPEIAGVLGDLGALWRALGQPAKTIYYFQQALWVIRAEYGGEHENTAKGMVNLGMVYFHLWQKDKANGYFEKALKIFDKLYGPEHAHTKKLTQLLKACMGEKK